MTFENILYIAWFIAGMIWMVAIGTKLYKGIKSLKHKE